MGSDVPQNRAALWIYWGTVLTVGAATIAGVAQYVATPGSRGGIGWFSTLIWLPALVGGLLLGTVIGVLARALEPRPGTGHPQDDPRPQPRSAALWTGICSAGGFLVIAGAMLLADRMVRPAEVFGGSVQAVLPVLIPAIPVGLIAALGTVVMPGTPMVGSEAPARLRGKRMLGAGIGAAVVGGVPLSLVPSLTFSFAAAIPFALGFPIAFVLLFCLASGCAGFRLRERRSR